MVRAYAPAEEYKYKKTDCTLNAVRLFFYHSSVWLLRFTADRSAKLFSFSVMPSFAFVHLFVGCLHGDVDILAVGYP